MGCLGPLWLGAMGPGPPSPLSKTVLIIVRVKNSGGRFYVQVVKGTCTRGKYPRPYISDPTSKNFIFNSMVTAPSPERTALMAMCVLYGPIATTGFAMLVTAGRKNGALLFSCPILLFSAPKSI